MKHRFLPMFHPTTTSTIQMYTKATNAEIKRAAYCVQEMKRRRVVLRENLKSTDGRDVMGESCTAEQLQVVVFFGKGNSLSLSNC